MAKTITKTKKYTVKRTYHYWYDVEALDEKDAVERARQIYPGNFVRMSDDGFEVVEKK